jgi:RNA polymerase sigma-70 factor (sigma-E family)
VADDIITFGGPDRGAGPKRDADEAIESLFHACYPAVVRTAFSLVGDWDLAEQLAQEAFLALWRRWRWIADPQAAPLYLQRTVVNLARGTIRRRVVERRVLKARSLERPADAPPDPAAVLELRAAISSLPGRKRECVVLRYLLGMSEAETASVLSVSVGTVKSQTHKGLRQLRERLDELTAPAGVTGVTGVTGSAGGAGSAQAGSAEAGRTERTAT